MNKRLMCLINALCMAGYAINASGLALGSTFYLIPNAKVQYDVNVKSGKRYLCLVTPMVSPLNVSIVTSETNGFKVDRVLVEINENQSYQKIIVFGDFPTQQPGYLTIQDDSNGKGNIVCNSV